ncbi:aromatic-ring hydroxylase C-terminal domain-containing protein [Phytohabitans houttuyneae]|uniref:FAD-binding domain-containing protein n=2 Tax=Phytohabitans houttuyneae TaxID=1076126 RepID=A0A6V8KG56_9ACTN|nr:hypothetical protein [Phytohabitans houttuyneae]GFJ82784.1 hypothetical protein Phou_069640 [Phytohabitans houttuyneae]
MDARKLPTAEAERQRQQLREAIALKNYEFNTLGVELNQRYDSAAVVPDGSPRPRNPRDDELHHHATTWPGAKVPHAWVCRGRARVSTLDLGGQGRFTVLTGVGGTGWVAAAAAVGAELGVPVAAVTIGPGADYEDLYGDWARLREVEDGGCLLLRPDNHVCFRAGTATADAAGDLRDALRRVLGLSTGAVG